MLPVLVVTGAVVGFVAALLGVGGGFIVVPVMYWVMSGAGVPEDIALRTAFGTSLLVIVPTVASSTYRHHKNGAVVWRVVHLGGCGLVGFRGSKSRHLRRGSEVGSACVRPRGFGANAYRHQVGGGRLRVSVSPRTAGLIVLGIVKGSSQA
jgi:hypothetical protein